ncbi:MAG TPA: hypothetical protein VFO79_09335 [Xanthomonadales bacterium]|nr:hypothetical protein [Xanthomonadales bacterium]
MRSLLPFAAALLLCVAPLAAHAQTDTTATSFQSELAATLERARAAKRGVVFHVHGATIAGAVKQVLADAVVVANREHAHIVIRLESIDAVEAD